MGQVTGTVSCDTCDISENDTTLRFTNKANGASEDFPVKDAKYSGNLPTGDYTLKLNCPKQSKWVAVTPDSVRLTTLPKVVNVKSSC